MPDPIVRLGVVFVGLFLILVTCAWSHGSTMTNIGLFGNDDNRKHLTASKSLGNLYIAVAGALVIALAALDRVSTEIIAVLFVAVLAGLGVKIRYDLKDK